MGLGTSIPFSTKTNTKHTVPRGLTAHFPNSVFSDRPDLWNSGVGPLKNVSHAAPKCLTIIAIEGNQEYRHVSKPVIRDRLGDVPKLSIELHPSNNSKREQGPTARDNAPSGLTFRNIYSRNRCGFQINDHGSM